MTAATKNKILAGVTVLVALALLYTGCKIGQHSILKNTGSDTVIVTHTDTLTTQPKPDTILETITKRMTVHDTLEIADDRPPIPATDTLKELKRLLAIERRFNQRAVYKDSAKGQTWKAVIYDTVYQDRLQKRRWEITTMDSVIKTTNILRPPRNFVAYLTFSTMGNFNNPLFSQSLGMAFKTPSDRVYQVAIVRAGDHRPMAQVSYFAPIRFTKHNP